MINLLSKVSIIDNSGAKEGIMIKRLIPKTSTKNSPATVGHIISISVRKTIPFTKKGNISNSGGQIAQKKNKVQRKNVYQALVVRTKKINNLINKKDFQKYPLQKNFFNFSTSPLNSYSPALRGVKGIDNKDFEITNSIGIFANTFYNLKFSDKTAENPQYLFKNNLNSQKFGGHKITWKDNAVILIKLVKSEFQPLGTRIKGPICKSLKMQKGCLKIVSISNIN